MVEFLLCVRPYSHELIGCFEHPRKVGIASKWGIKRIKYLPNVIQLENEGGRIQSLSYTRICIV